MAPSPAAPSLPSISSPCYTAALATRSNARSKNALTRTALSTAAGLESQQIICAVSESRGISPTVGLAFVNIDTCEVVMCQISDTQTYVRTMHKLIVFAPSEILIVSSASNPKSKLLSIIEDNVQDLDCAVTLLDRRYWAENSGVEYIQQLALTEEVEALNVAISGNYFAVCCVAAVLRYIESSLNKTFALHSLRFRYEPSEGAMMIDVSTIRSLELIQNLHDSKSSDCLFGLLNATQSAMGARLLRSSILQPLTHEETLNTRYEALQELTTQETVFFGVRHALKDFVDLDKTLTALVVESVKDELPVAGQRINNIIMLRQAVVSIRPIYEALAGVHSMLLVEIRDLCAPKNIHHIQDTIDTVINEDVKYSRNPIDLRNQRTFAIKSGIVSMLDVSRTTFKENSDDIRVYVAQLAEEHGLKLELKYDTARQYFIRFPESDLQDRGMPNVFINVVRKRIIVECSTLDLMKKTKRVLDSHNECLLLSNDAVQALISEIRVFIPAMFKICEGIAMLDMLYAFAQLAISQDYVRPSINETLAIKAGRHPIKEKIQKTKFVPNDVYATQQTRFQIITGCNMSGKSTYLRSVALITIMAQIGCFVPAEFASLPIIQQLFARVSVDDNISTNMSTFAAEMQETAFILQNIGRHSLAIIDELGRGTSTTDGLAIAIAIAEALIESRALVWFATHFLELSQVLAARPGVVSLHLAVDTSDPTALEMLYKVEAGAVEDQHYGLLLARTLPLPEFVIQCATEVSQAIKEKMESRRQISDAVILQKRRKLILSLKEHLTQAHQGKMEGEALQNWLKELQRVFVERMSALDEEGRVAESTEEDDSEGEDDVADGSDESMLDGLPGSDRPHTEASTNTSSYILRTPQ